MNDDHKAKLEAWGNETAPQPDPAFAERLEADLRSAAYFASTETVDKSPRLFRPAIVLAAILIVAGIGLAGINSLGDQGTVAPAETPRVEPTPSPSPTPTASPTTTPNPTPTAAAANNPGPSEDTAQPTATASTPSTPLPQADAAAPTMPPATEPTPPQPDTEAPRDPTSTSTATPTPTPPEIEATTTPETTSPTAVVSLSRRYLADGRARLTWTAEPADNVAAWRLVISRGETERVTQRFGPARTNVTVERLERARVTYYLEAITADGAVLGRSNGVRVAAAP